MYNRKIVVIGFVKTVTVVDYQSSIDLRIRDYQHKYHTLANVGYFFKNKALMDIYYCNERDVDSLLEIIDGRIFISAPQPMNPMRLDPAYVSYINEKLRARN